MASGKTTDWNATPVPKDENELRGGTQEGGAAGKLPDPRIKESGTPNITAPTGDARIEPPSQAVPRTDRSKGP